MATGSFLCFVGKMVMLAGLGELYSRPDVCEVPCLDFPSHEWRRENA